jgi:hydrogenase nickel incorporation protein HypA/HybF
MHELAIADAIVGVASRHANGRHVSRVDVRVGHLRQVVPDSLQFSFELMSRGTTLDGAELVIEEVPAHTDCRRCGARGVLEEFPAMCGGCGSLDVDLTGGDELLVDSIELEEEALTGG